MDKEDFKFRTSGYGSMSAQEPKEFKRLLKKAGAKTRTVATKDGEEIILLKVSVSGLLPEIFTFLHGIGMDLIDKLQQ